MNTCEISELLIGSSERGAPYYNDPATLTGAGLSSLCAAEALTAELRIGQKVTAKPEYLLGDADDT